MAEYLSLPLYKQFKHHDRVDLAKLLPKLGDAGIDLLSVCVSAHGRCVAACKIFC